MGARLKDRTDVQIYRILAAPEDYLPEVVEAARKEFEERKLNRRELLGYQEKKKLKRLTLAREPLPLFSRLLFLFFPLLFFQFLFLETYRYAGAERKIHEVKIWSLYGAALWSLLLILSGGLVFFLS